MRNRFDMQLDNLNRQLTAMGTLCKRAIANVAMSLQSGDVQLAKQVIHEDEEIDQMEKEIESLALKLLLQQQPVARDLRQISAALKMITDMERIGDQTADIAEIIISAGMPDIQNFEIIFRMAEATSRMVENSIVAYVNKDLNLARKVMKADDEVDGLFDEIKAKLVTVITERTDDIGEMSIDILMIAKYLERIGDHATNIAEWVEFSITGVHKDSAGI